MSVRERTSGKPLLATIAGREMAPGLVGGLSGGARRKPVSLRQALAAAAASPQTLPPVTPKPWDGARGLPRWVDAARRERGRSRLAAAKGWLATIAVTGLIIGTAAHFLAARPHVPAPVAARPN